MNIMTLCGDFNTILEVLAITDFVFDVAILILPLPTVSSSKPGGKAVSMMLIVIDLEIAHAFITEAGCDTRVCPRRVRCCRIHH